MGLDNDSVDWNIGAVYGSASDRALVLVPGDGYGDTKFYHVGTDLKLTEVLNTKGWAMRLFKVD